MSLLRIIARNRLIFQSKQKLLNTRSIETLNGEDDKKSGTFADAFNKFENIVEEKPTEPLQTFQTLLRNSKFMDVSCKSSNSMFSHWISFFFSVGRS